jgi:hypothetical protein
MNEMNDSPVGVSIHASNLHPYGKQDILHHARTAAIRGFGIRESSIPTDMSVIIVAGLQRQSEKSVRLV